MLNCKMLQREMLNYHSVFRPIARCSVARCLTTSCCHRCFARLPDAPLPAANCQSLFQLIARCSIAIRRSAQLPEAPLSLSFHMLSSMCRSIARCSIATCQLPIAVPAAASAQLPLTVSPNSQSLNCQMLDCQMLLSLFRPIARCSIGHGLS